MENIGIDRPAVRIGFPYFAALLLSSFFGASFSAFAAVLLLIVVLLCFLLKCGRRANGANILLSLAAAAAAFAVFSAAYNVYVLPAARYDGSKYPVTGTILSRSTENTGRFYYKMHVTRIDDPVQDVDFNIRISHGEAFPAEIGDTVSCEVKFASFEDDLGLSSRTARLADGTVLSAYVTDYASVRVTPAKTHPFSYYVNRIREYFHNLILENYAEAEGSVLSAMLLGLRDDMPASLTTAYRDAGASHILAISGMHMAVLTQFTLGFLSLLGLKRRPAAAAAVVFTLLFIPVSGLSASVVRSGIMQLILLFGVLLGRSAEPLNSLAVAILGMSLANPFCSGDVSLLFSLAATLGILLLAPRITKKCTQRFRSSRRKKHFTRLVSVLAVSFSAALFTVPLQLYLFGRAQLVSLLTSLLVLPVSAWLLRCGLLALLLLSVPGLAPCAQPFVFLSGLAAKLQNLVVRFVSAHIPGTLYISGRYLPAALLICTLFFAASVLVFYKRSKVLPCILTLCVFFCGMGADAALSRNVTRLLVLRTEYASCTAVLYRNTADILQCNGDAASVERALRANGAARVHLLHVQSDEKSIRCAAQLSKAFETERILLPEGVYFPTDSAAFYGFGTTDVLSNGAALTVSDGGETVLFTQDHAKIYLETKHSTSLAEGADILITEKPQSAVISPFTILKTDAIIEDIAKTLSPGDYILTDTHPCIRLDFDESGTYTVYGG